MSKFSYFTLIIPFTEKNATRWHPTTDVGPFSTISRGAFKTVKAARDWARENLGPDAVYSVKKFAVAHDDDRISADLVIPLVNLAAEYARSVTTFRAFGDHHPEYHARQPKVKAYGLLLNAGLSPREAIDFFRAVLEGEALEAASLLGTASNTVRA